MRSTTVCHAWVVYRMTLPKKVMGGNVVCEQREWDAIEAARPGYHTLLRSGIGTEQEAEKLARGVTVEIVPRVVQKKAEITPLFATDISAARTASPRPRYLVGRAPAHGPLDAPVTNRPLRVWGR